MDDGRWSRKWPLLFTLLRCSGYISSGRRLLVLIIVVDMELNDLAWCASSVTFLLINVLASRCAIRLKRSRQIAERTAIARITQRSVDPTEAVMQSEQSELSAAQIAEFQRRGVLVIRDFLSADEVAAARRGIVCSIYS
jgi:hypothetical protein